jgi:hypothetical protein
VGTTPSGKKYKIGQIYQYRQEQKMTVQMNGQQLDLTLEEKVETLTWLLHEQSDRVIRLAQVIASLLVQQSQPAITNQVMAQLLNPATTIQGAPPVLP